MKEKSAIVEKTFYQTI